MDAMLQLRELTLLMNLSSNQGVERLDERGKDHKKVFVFCIFVCLLPLWIPESCKSVAN